MPALNAMRSSICTNLQADPYELTNLAGLESHRRAADVLRERLLRLMGEAGEAPGRDRPGPASGQAGNGS